MALLEANLVLNIELTASSPFGPKGGKSLNEKDAWILILDDKKTPTTCRRNVGDSLRAHTGKKGENETYPNWPDMH